MATLVNRAESIVTVSLCNFRQADVALLCPDAEHPYDPLLRVFADHAHEQRQVLRA